MKDHLPRILIHCGHTICHSCLLNFYKNRRVRCPLCLKLIKHLDSVERLPVHTHQIIIRSITQSSLASPRKSIIRAKCMVHIMFYFRRYRSTRSIVISFHLVPIECSLSLENEVVVAVPLTWYAYG